MATKTLRPGDPVESSPLIENVSKSHALQAYMGEVRRMRLAGFRVRQSTNEGNNLPVAIVRNPITGTDECKYWLAEAQ